MLEVYEIPAEDFLRRPAYMKGASCAQELAVMVARSRDGSTQAFPVVETVHQNSILLVTEAPAHVATEVLQRAQKVAERAVACLDGERHRSEPASLAVVPGISLAITPHSQQQISSEKSS